MDLPGKRIVKFIRKHHVLTLATCINRNPWCASCFYVYIKEDNCLVFLSDFETKHARDASVNPCIAGSIALETKLVGKIQGIQFRGIMSLPDGDAQSKFKIAYLQRFPYAILSKTKLWIVKLNYIKMTDNRLGFGKKIIWESMTRNDII